MVEDKELVRSGAVKNTTFAREKSSSLRFSNLSFAEFSISAPPADILASFDQLDFDKHTKGEWRFRRRAYSSALLDRTGKLEWSSDTSFFQAQQLNTYAGDIIRKFEPLACIVKDYVEGLLNSDFYKELREGASYYIGVHQIRTQCDDDNLGFPVPEGYHQDGFDYVGTHCLANTNALGGTSLLRLGKKTGTTVFWKDLEVKKGLVFNDREYFHYVSPIFPRESGIGHRDMVVITFLKKNDQVSQDV